MKPIIYSKIRKHLQSKKWFFTFVTDQWGSEVGWGITIAFENLVNWTLKFGYVSFALSAIKFIHHSQKVMYGSSMEAQEADLYVETKTLSWLHGV